MVVTFTVLSPLPSRMLMLVLASTKTEMLVSMLVLVVFTPTTSVLPSTLVPLVVVMVVLPAMAVVTSVVTPSVEALSVALVAHGSNSMLKKKKPKKKAKKVVNTSGE